MSHSFQFPKRTVQTFHSVHVQWNQKDCSRTRYFTNKGSQVVCSFLSPEQNISRMSIQAYVETSIHNSRSQSSCLYWLCTATVWTGLFEIWNKCDKNLTSVNFSHTIQHSKVSYSSRKANSISCGSLKAWNQISCNHFVVTLRRQW